MQDKHLLPEAIICSPALRTWQTVTTVCQGLQIDPASISFDKHLYMAETVGLAQLIAATDRTINSLLLVGHNPGLEELLTLLLDTEPPAGPNGKLIPTATLCILRLDDWSVLAPGAASLVEIIRPKSII